MDEVKKEEVVERKTILKMKECVGRSILSYIKGYALSVATVLGVTGLTYLIGHPVDPQSTTFLMTGITGPVGGVIQMFAENKKNREKSTKVVEEEELDKGL